MSLVELILYMVFVTGVSLQICVSKYDVRGYDLPLNTSPYNVLSLDANDTLDTTVTSCCELCTAEKSCLSFVHHNNSCTLFEDKIDLVESQSGNESQAQTKQYTYAITTSESTNTNTNTTTTTPKPTTNINIIIVASCGGVAVFLLLILIVLIILKCRQKAKSASNSATQEKSRSIQSAQHIASPGDMFSDAQSINEDLQGVKNMGGKNKKKNKLSKNEEGAPLSFNGSDLRRYEELEGTKGTDTLSGIDSIQNKSSFSFDPDKAALDVVSSATMIGLDSQTLMTDTRSQTIIE